MQLFTSDKAYSLSPFREMLFSLRHNRNPSFFLAQRCIRMSLYKLKIYLLICLMSARSVAARNFKVE